MTNRRAGAGRCATVRRYSTGASMPRPILDEDHIHPAIRSKVAGHQQAIVQEVMAAIASNAVVVVGMAQNPFPKKACAALQQAGLPFKYVEYGSYLSRWRERNALKLWTGWPTFPMVFVKGTLVGGYNDLKALIDSGELKRMVAA
jgi:monothiol glutaredoxin